jgi:hypothetical protein
MINQIPNPYNFNLPVSPEMFYGRKEELKKIMDDLTGARGNSIALVGGRRIGKTSLLEALLRKLEESSRRQFIFTVPVFIDLSGAGIASPTMLFQSFSDQAQRIISDRIGLTLEPLVLSNEYPPAPKLSRLLPDWNQAILREAGIPLRLIVIFDECERIVKEHWAPELYGALRHLIVGQTTRSLFKVVMVGSQTFLSRVRQEGSPLRNVLNYHYLNAMDADSARALITVPFIKSLSNEFVEAIIAKSGRHPFLIQYLMYHLWNQEFTNIDISVVEKVSRSFYHQRGDFEDWFYELSLTAQRMYTNLVESETSISEKDLRQIFSTPIPDFSSSLESLSYHGLVLDGGDGTYMAGSQMFQIWFKENVGNISSKNGAEPSRPKAERKSKRIYSNKSSVIKILFLAANPKDTPPLRLDEEIRAIDNALLQAKFRDRFDIKQHWAVRVFDLQGYLLRYKPDIVHFSGHGNSSSGIILEDEIGNSHEVSPRALSQLFSVLKDKMRCVVLNACYSENQAKAIAEHIDCVIGMSRAISDNAAIEFAQSFYQGLGYGRDVKTSFDLGCVEIDLKNLNEESTPKIVALRKDPKKIVFT